MSREQEIEKMAKVLIDAGEDCGGIDTCPHCDFYEIPDGKCLYYLHSALLYNAGYLNADEVRKETAREIIDSLIYEIPETIICTKCKYFGEPCGCNSKDGYCAEYYIVQEIMESKAKQYGVEVEE